jgi:CCR4-NOT complex subunit CAF16
MSSAIEVSGVSFKYSVNEDQRRALTTQEIADAPNVLHEVNFSLPSGSRAILIGENGAGKSTVLQLLAGRTKVLGGTIRVGGKDPYEHRSGIGLLGSDWATRIGTMNSVKVSELMNSSHHTPEVRARVQKLAALLQVQPDWLSTELSEGQKRRVQLTCQLAPLHDVYMLDEIIAELDPLARRRLLLFLRRDSEERGATVVICSHVFDGLEAPFTTHVVQMHKGKCVRVHNLGDPGPDGDDQLAVKLLQWLVEMDGEDEGEDEEVEDKDTWADWGIPEIKIDEDKPPVAMDTFGWGYANRGALFADATVQLPQRGRCVLTGANGAGKSTLLSLLSGKRLAIGHEGTMSVLGADPSSDHQVANKLVTHVSMQWRTQIMELGAGAYMTVDALCESALIHAIKSNVLRKRNLDQQQDARSNTGSSEEDKWRQQRLQARLAKLRRLLRVEGQWQLGKISAGQRARVQLVLQLLLPRPLILLDELLAELDIRSRTSLLKFLRKETERANRPSTVLYASHVLEDCAEDGWLTHLLHLRRGRAASLVSAVSLPELISAGAATAEKLAAAGLGGVHSCGLYGVVLGWLVQEEQQALKEGAEAPRQIETSDPGGSQHRGAQSEEVPPGWFHRQHVTSGGYGNAKWNATDKVEEGAAGWRDAALAAQELEVGAGQSVRAPGVGQVAAAKTAAKAAPSKPKAASSVPFGFGNRNNSISPAQLAQQGSAVVQQGDARSMVTDPGSTASRGAPAPRAPPMPQVVLTPRATSGSSSSGSSSSSSSSSSATASVLLPALDQFLASATVMRACVASGDVSGAQLERGKAAMLWAMLQPAVDMVVGAGTTHGVGVGAGATLLTPPLTKVKPPTTKVKPPTTRAAPLAQRTTHQTKAGGTGTNAEDASFIASPSFRGPKEGFAYKHGAQGMGYYRDQYSIVMLEQKKKMEQSASAPAPAPPVRAPAPAPAPKKAELPFGFGDRHNMKSEADLVMEGRIMGETPSFMQQYTDPIPGRK